MEQNYANAIFVMGRDTGIHNASPGWESIGAWKQDVKANGDIQHPWAYNGNTWAAAANGDRPTVRAYLNTTHTNCKAGYKWEYLNDGAVSLIGQTDMEGAIVGGWLPLGSEDGWAVYKDTGGRFMMRRKGTDEQVMPIADFGSLNNLTTDQLLCTFSSSVNNIDNPSWQPSQDILISTVAASGYMCSIICVRTSDGTKRGNTLGDGDTSLKLKTMLEYTGESEITITKNDYWFEWHKGLHVKTNATTGYSDNDDVFARGKGLDEITVTRDDVDSEQLFTVCIYKASSPDSTAENDCSVTHRLCQTAITVRDKADEYTLESISYTRAGMNTPCTREIALRKLVNGAWVTVNPVTAFGAGNFQWNYRIYKPEDSVSGLDGTAFTVPQTQGNTLVVSIPASSYDSDNMSEYHLEVRFIGGM